MRALTVGVALALSVAIGLAGAGCSEHAAAEARRAAPAREAEVEAEVAAQVHPQAEAEAARAAPPGPRETAEAGGSTARPAENVDEASFEARQEVPLRDPRPEAPGRAPSVEGARGLGRFFAALRRVEREGGLARVTHLGDSSIGMDDLPHALRTRFQSRFGDGGPGFVILPASSSQVLNRTIAMRTTIPWDDVCQVIDRCERDGHYGLGGVRVETRGGGDTLIRPRDGRPVRRAELWYAAQPGGGRLRFYFGGQLAEVETAGPALEDRWYVLSASEAGEHAVRVAAAPGGVSRGYGVVLENDGPGLVWDSLSLVGAFTPRLLSHDEAHFARQLAHRDPDLVVLNFGGNDLRRLIGGRVSEAGLADETHQLLRRVREAVPEAGCLLVGINDHERSGEADVEAEHVEAVVRAQRAAAERAGCAHYPTLDAMGGAGSFSRWYAAGLGAFDRKHLSPRGRDVLAARIHAALLHAGGLTGR